MIAMRIFMLVRLALAAAIGLFAYRHMPDLIAHADQLADTLTAHVKELTR